MRQVLWVALAALVLATALPAVAKDGKSEDHGGGSGHGSADSQSASVTSSTTSAATSKADHGKADNGNKSTTTADERGRGNDDKNATDAHGHGADHSDQGHGGNASDATKGAGHGSHDANATDDDHGKGHGRELFGEPTLEGDRLNGTFVTFRFDPATGVLSAYEVGNESRTALVASATPDHYDPAAVKVEASSLRVHSKTFHLDAHDEPSGSVYWQAKANVTLTFALAANVTATSSGAHEAVLKAAPWHAHIVARGANVTAANGTVTVVLHHGDQVALRAHPPGLGTTLHTENKLLSHGRLGAVARIGHGGASDVQSLDVNVTAHNATADRVELTIGSDQHEGRSVVLLLGTLDAARPEDVTVQLGNETMTASFDAPEAGEFQVVSGAEGLSLELNVTHFSSYSVTVSQTSTMDRESEGAPGFGLVALLGAVAVALAARRVR